LVQLLSNLIDNAIRHTDRGGHVQIQAHLAPPPQGKTASQIRLIVSDTGEGIAPDHLPRVFDRFNRGGESNRQRDGFGLGLANVRENV
jgi:signal transduction histidine kinase